MDNPYQAPSSRVDEPARTEPVLAGRGARFGAVFVDGLIMGVLLIPLERVSGYTARLQAAMLAHQPLPYGEAFFWAMVGMAIFAVTQAYPLIKDGQTWGKKACSIRIESMDGSKPSIRQLLVRYAVFFTVGNIPIAGPIISLVNICLIFRGDRRCGHDLLAGTHVVIV